MPDTTIIYGVKIYPRYLARFEAPEGPILKSTIFSPRHDDDAVIDDGHAIGPVPSGSDLPRGRWPVSATGRGATNSGPRRFRTGSIPESLPTVTDPHP